MPRAKPNLKPRTAVCSDCSSPFEVLKVGPLPKRCPEHSSGNRECDRCGKTCRPGVGNSTCVDCLDHHCRWCGESVAGQRQYCDDACKALHRRKQLDVNCGQCGERFIRETGNQKYCSLKCRRRRALELFKERYPDEPRTAKWTEKRKALWHARRQLKKDRTVGSPFKPAEIHERDGWICGYCHEPVDRTIRWPDTRSPSIDHVIPLSRGGEHSRANVQTTHLGCNIAKSDSVDVQATLVE